MTILIPPLATSRKRRWNPLNSLPKKKGTFSQPAKKKGGEGLADDKEHPERLFGVLYLRQEIWRETEGHCDFGGLIKVRL